MRLTISHLRFSYQSKKGTHPVFSDLNLEIPSSSFCVLLGPSGCGKSTLLRCLAGFLDYEGTVEADGMPLETIPSSKRGFAYLSQEYDLYPHMTVFDNLAFPLKNEGAGYDEINARVAETAKRLGLYPFLSRKPRQLSGGQCQRVALGRALIRFASLYLLDEPFSNVDESTRALLFALLKEIHAESQATFLYATHSLSEAMRLGEGIAVLNAKGELEQVGTPKEIYFHPKQGIATDLVKSDREAKARFEEAVS